MWKTILGEDLGPDGDIRDIIPAYYPGGHFPILDPRDRQEWAARIPGAQKILAELDSDLDCFDLALRLHALLGSERIERVHAHFVQQEARAGGILARFLGVPFSVSTHSGDIRVPRDRNLVHRVLKSADCIFAISEANAAWLQAEYGESLRAPLVVSHLGVDPDDLFEHERPEGPAHIVCVASGLVEAKGVPVLLDALEILARTGNAVSCTIYGADPEGIIWRRLQADVQERGLSQNVKCPGAVPFRDVLRAVANASVFCLPCVRAANGAMDGIPTSLLEAMGTGTPVVSTTMDSIPELVTQGVDGLLIPPGDATALANALGSILANRPWAESMGQIARAKVRDRFTVAAHLDRMLAAWFRDGSAAKW